MSLSLDPQAERELNRAAAMRGVPPETALSQAVRDWATQQIPASRKAGRSLHDTTNNGRQDGPEIRQEDHRATVEAARGMFAGRIPAMAKFVAERHAEAQREAVKDEQLVRNYGDER